MRTLPELGGEGSSAGNGDGGVYGSNELALGDRRGRRRRPTEPVAAGVLG